MSFSSFVVPARTSGMSGPSTMGAPRKGQGGSPDPPPLISTNFSHIITVAPRVSIQMHLSGSVGHPMTKMLSASGGLQKILWAPRPCLQRTWASDDAYERDWDGSIYRSTLKIRLRVEKDLSNVAVATGNNGSRLSAPGNVGYIRMYCDDVAIIIICFSDDRSPSSLWVNSHSFCSSCENAPKTCAMLLKSGVEVLCRRTSCTLQRLLTSSEKRISKLLITFSIN